MNFITDKLTAFLATFDNPSEQPKTLQNHNQQLIYSRNKNRYKKEPPWKTR